MNSRDLMRQDIHYFMTKQMFLVFAILLVTGCETKNSDKNPNRHTATFECDLFSIDFPKCYYVNDVTEEGSIHHTLQIGTDSLDSNTTTIEWESPNSYPGSVEEFVTLFVYLEMSSCTDYEVISVDSLYRIDGHLAYSISSVFTEDKDTIIQSRTGLIIPGRCDMMIVQRANSCTSEADVKKMTDILSTIKIKED